MQKGDLDQIVNIERMSFLSPWKWEHFQSELEKDFGISIIAEVDQFIVGYLIGWFVANEIHIGNIAVHPKWRRKGIGEMMIQKLLTEYKSCSLVQLEVRFSNRAARSLYRKLGFYEIGIRKNYYTFEREDAVLMEKRLSI
ncbi:ribosomal protein S18-alanine N-acetyltransferase [bacterium]|nr:ribosomal protein S18-alanine N-acetyltransferase [bacterium]